MSGKGQSRQRYISLCAAHTYMLQKGRRKFFSVTPCVPKMATKGGVISVFLCLIQIDGTEVRKVELAGQLMLHIPQSWSGITPDQARCVGLGTAKMICSIFDSTEAL